MSVHITPVFLTHVSPDQVFEKLLKIRFCVLFFSVMQSDGT